MAWISGWLYRKKITIDETKVDANLTDFPVLVKLTSSNFDFTKALSTGYDIRFTSSDGETLLKYERQRHDNINSLAEYWVKVPSVSGTVNTEFYIYYGNSGAADGADPTNVWDANFCYDKETEILTDNGWKFFKNLDKSEKVATLNPKTGILEFKKPFRYISYHYEGKMFQIVDSHQVDLKVIPDHNMYVARRDSSKNSENDWKEYRLEKAKDIFDKQVRYKKDAKWNGVEQDEFILPAVEFQYYTGNQFKKGITKSKTTSSIKIEMDTWLEFLGYFLSEGYSKYKSEGKRRQYSVTIAQSSNYSERVKKIEECLKKLPFKYRYDGQAFTIHSKQLTSYTKRFGKSKDKFISNEVKSLSTRQLKILFNALMLGDGFKDGRSYSTISKKLADDFQELTLKIGRASNLYEYSKGRKNPIFTLSLIGEQLRPYIYNKDKAGRIARNEWIEYNDKVYSVEIENHIIYVRRNGKPVWSGNCAVHHLKDITTSTVNDSTANANNGTKKAANEPIEANGKIGKAQSYDGVNDYVEIPHSDAFPRGDVTIEFWLYQREYGSPASYITKRTINGDGLMFFMHTGKKLYFDWGDGNLNRRWDTGYIPLLNEWVHLTITRNASGRYLYVNGNFHSSTTNPGGPIPETNTSKIMLMRDSVNPQHYANGIIDEVRISKVARLADWIKADYNSGNDTLASYGGEETLVLTKANLLTMDYAYQGQPFVDVQSKISVDIKTMDWAYLAQPFIRNYSSFFSKTYTEAIIISDTLTLIRTLGKVFTEAVTIVDSIIRTTGRILSEVVTIVDNITKTVVYQKILSEVVTVVDSFIKQTGKIFSETVTVVDSFIKQTGKIFSEVVTIVDTITTLRTAFITLATETITVIDTFTKITGRILTETVLIVDSFIRQAGKVLTEPITITDIRDFFKHARGLIFGLNKNTGIGQGTPLR